MSGDVSLSRCILTLFINKILLFHSLLIIHLFACKIIIIHKLLKTPHFFRNLGFFLFKQLLKNLVY